MFEPVRKGFYPEARGFPQHAFKKFSDSCAPNEPIMSTGASVGMISAALVLTPGADLVM